MSKLSTIKCIIRFQINLLFYVSTNVEVAHRLLQSMRLFIHHRLKTIDRHTVTMVMFFIFRPTINHLAPTTVNILEFVLDRL